MRKRKLAYQQIILEMVVNDEVKAVGSQELQGGEKALVNAIRWNPRVAVSCRCRLRNEFLPKGTLQLVEAMTVLTIEPNDAAHDRRGDGCSRGVGPGARGGGGNI